MSNLTEKAKIELQELEAESEALNNKSNSLYQRGMKYEAKSYERKWVRTRDKISDIESTGLSSSESYAIKKTIPSMFTISISRSLGVEEKEATGFVPSLNNYVIVNYSKYNSFMRNVRGMASLAGSISIHDVRFINKQIYDNITKGVQEKGGYRRETSFAGARQIMRGSQEVKREPSYDKLEGF